MKKLEQELKKYLLSQIDFYAGLTKTPLEEHCRDTFRGYLQAYVETLETLYEISKKLQKEEKENEKL